MTAPPIVPTDYVRKGASIGVAKVDGTLHPAAIVEAGCWEILSLSITAPAATQTTRYLTRHPLP